MHPDCVASVRDQCREANVPFLFKQWGNWEFMMDADSWALEVGGMEASEVRNMSANVCVLEPGGKVHLPTKPLREFWTKADWDNGWVYDPKEGKSYDAAVALEGRSKLLMTGYKGIKLLSKTLTWTRAPAELPRCQNGV